MLIETALDYARHGDTVMILNDGRREADNTFDQILDRAGDLADRVVRANGAEAVHFPGGGAIRCRSVPEARGLSADVVVARMRTLSIDTALMQAHAIVASTPSPRVIGVPELRERA